MHSRLSANLPPTPLSPKPLSTRSVRTPPTPLSALNRSFVVMGNSFQSGDPRGTVYQDEFSVRYAPIQGSASTRRVQQDEDCSGWPSVDPMERQVRGIYAALFHSDYIEDFAVLCGSVILPWPGS